MYRSKQIVTETSWFYDANCLSYKKPSIHSKIMPLTAELSTTSLYGFFGSLSVCICVHAQGIRNEFVDHRVLAVPC